jgi:RNA polymerase sigma-70 factor (ECF subfamily)
MTSKLEDITQDERRLMSFALRLTEHYQDAEDLLQATYEKAVTSASQFEQGTSLLSWLFKIMHNTNINNHRAKSAIKRPKMTSEEMKDWQHPKSMSAESVVLSSLADTDVARTLQSMPPKFSRVLYLSAVEDYSIKEIAEHEGIPEGTVMSRAMRARQKFREGYTGSIRQ